jgi:hypothetical protein
MDSNFFENDIFYQIFHMKLNKIIWLYKKTFFQEYFSKSSHKNNKKQVGVICVIPFAPPLDIGYNFPPTTMFPNTVQFKG